MSLKFEAAQDSIQSINADIEILIELIKDNNSNDRSRNLFIKIAIVLLVTKFQVFIENILDEFLDLLNRNQVKFDHIPYFLKLNSIRVAIENSKLKEKLSNFEKFNDNDFVNNIKQTINSMNSHFTTEINSGYLQLKSKFPLGKTGANELKDLFLQINGEDVFTACSIDIDKLNSLLNIRHNVIHKDATPGLTEETIVDYKEFLIYFIEQIDGYLFNFFKNIGG